MEYSQKIPKSLLATVLLLVIAMATLHTSFSQNSVPQPQPINELINVGEQYGVEIKIDQGGMQIYEMHINQPHPQEYLFITIDTLNQKWVPFSITLYLDQQLLKPVLVCHKSNDDICYIKGTELQSHSYFVVAECQDDCVFMFDSYWDSIKVISDDDATQPFQLVMQENKSSALYKFDLQNPPAAFRFTAVSFGDRLFTQSLMLYGSFDQMPTPENYQFKSMPLWNKGQGLFINGQKFTGKPLYVLFDGEKQTSYHMVNTFLIDDFLDVVQGVPVHDFLTSNSVHRYLFDTTSTSKIDFIYSITFETFQGNLKVGFYTDEQLTQQFQTDPIVYKGKSKYNFPSKILKQKGIKTLYAKLSSAKGQMTVSTYLDREKFESSTHLQQNVYTFLVVSQKHLLYFPFKDYGVKINNQNLPFEINTFQQLKTKNVKLKFRICNSNLISCTTLDQYESKSTQIKDIDISSVDDKDLAHLIYKIKVKKEVYQKYTKQKKEGIIVVQLDLIDSSKQGFISAHLNNPNNIQKINDSKAQKIQGMVEQNSNKVYYYHYQDKTQISKINVYLVSLSGQAKLKWSTSKAFDITYQASLKNKQMNYAFSFTQNLNEPFFIWVEGVSQSLYVLHIEKQLKEKKIHTSNIIKLNDDQQQEITLKTQEVILLQIKSPQKDLKFNFDSSGKIGACQIDAPNSKCNKKQPPIIGNKNQVSLIPPQNGITYVRIFNTNMKRAIKLTVSYHGGTGLHCTKKSLGKVYQDLLESNSCLSFDLSDVNDDIQMTFVRIQLASLSLHLQICGQRYVVQKPLFTVTNQQINKFCDHKKQKQLKVVFKSQQGNIIKITYCVQPLSDTLQLTDGVAFNQNVISKGTQVLKKYIYDVFNKVDTEIIIRNRIGYVNFYAKIVEASEIQKTVLDSKNYQFQGDSYYYSSNDLIVFVNQQDLKDAKCQDCLIYIAVYPDQFTIQGSVINYSVQVTSNTLTLNDHEAITKFLSQGSTAYFKFLCTGQDTLYFDSSDNHQECSKVSMGRFEYPTESSAEQVSVTGNIIAKCETENPQFFFSVEAINDCPITVTASSSPFKLNKITQSVPFEFKIQSSQTIFFLYYQSNAQQFKITSLQRYGDVEIYATEVTDALLSVLTSDSSKLDLESFSFKNTYKNEIQINKDSAGFCKDCPFLIAIKAESDYVDSQIIVTQNDNPIPISTNTIVYDQIVKNQISKLNIYSTLKGKIAVTLNKGGIQLTAKYGQAKSNTWRVQQAKDISQFDYDFVQKGQNLYYWDPVTIQIKNIDQEINSYYSLIVTGDQDIGSYARSIKAGVGSYIFFNGKDDKKCVKGNFISNSQKIYLTVDLVYKDKLNNIDIEVDIDDKSIEYHAHKIQNILEISVERQGEPGIKQYKMCLINKNDDIVFDLKILQAGQVNVIASQQAVLSNGQNIFMFHPENMFLLDTFLCQGSLNIKYSSSYEEIQDKSVNYRQIDTMDKITGLESQNTHANYFEDYSQTVFTAFEKDSVSFIRWMEFDQYRSFGTGYLDYKSGNVMFNGLDKQLSVMWQPVRPLVESLKTKIIEARYTVFVAETQQQAKSAANCGTLSPQNFFSKSQTFGSQRHQQLSSGGKWMQLLLDKQSLKKWFSYVKTEEKGTTYKLNENSDQSAPELLYITVQADITIYVPKQEQQQAKTEYYRFLYDIQPLPLRQVLEEGVVTQRIPYAAILGAAVFVSILAIGCLIYVILKKLVPLISRLRRANYLQNQQVGTCSKPTMEENAQSHKNLESDVNV